MDMWVVIEALVPAVQNGQKTDAHTEAFGIRGHLAQCFRAGPKQDAVDHGGILQGQGCCLMREGEDDVGVRDGQNLTCSFL